MSYRQPVPTFHRVGVELACGPDSAAGQLGAVVLGTPPMTAALAPPGAAVSPGIARRERELDFAMDAVFEPQDRER